MIAAGQRIGARDLALAHAVGLASLPVRRPRAYVVAVQAADGRTVTMPMIAALLRREGADVAMTEVMARDVKSIAGAIGAANDERSCDLLLLIGGTGAGRTDATLVALAERGVVHAHGIAQRPGRTAALGRIGNLPVIALPGAPSDALAVWYGAVEPLLDRLSGYRRGDTQRLPLLRKIASTVGIAEFVVLARHEAGWMPLATGDIPLERWVCADAWLRVAEDSEGYAAGTMIEARCFREGQ